MPKGIAKLLPPTRIRSADVTAREMALGYLAAPFCAMLANAIFGAYLNRYYVDVLGWTKFGAFATLLPVASTALVIPGNLLVGRWIDRTRTPAGRARPYLLLSMPLAAAATLLLFRAPNRAGPGAQMVWIAATYILYYALAMPCYSTAHNSLVSLSTRDADRRGLLATLSNAAGVGAAGVGASILAPVLLQPFMFVAGEAGLNAQASYANWRTLSVGFAALTAAGMAVEYLYTRERITEEAQALNPRQAKIPMARHVRACARDRYWRLAMAFALVYQFGQLCRNASLSFYSRWMFDSVIRAASPEAASARLMSAMGLLGGLPAAAGMVVAWPLARKLGKRRAIALGLCFSALGGLTAFINVHSFPLVCLATVLKGIGIIPAQYVMLALISDVLDHLEARNGFRSDGFTMSLYSSVMGGLGGVGMGAINAMLTFSGYSNAGHPADAATGAFLGDLAARTGAVVFRQAGGTEAVLVFCYLGVEVLCCAAAAALLWKMDVERHAEADRRAIEARRRAAEDA